MDLRAEKVDLRKLLGNGFEQFRVPEYQRAYAWGPDQIDDLWEDLTHAVDDVHFMGSLVINTQNDERPEVIDGQQRLTTLLLLLSLIRDRLVALGDSVTSRSIEQLFITNAPGSGDDTFKLCVGQANWSVFRDFVLRLDGHDKRKGWGQVDTLTREVRSRNQKLIAGASRLASKLDFWVDGSSEVEARSLLGRLTAKIMSRLEFVAIRVTTVEDAFLLFETLNDRGLQLSAGDLLKNHLLAQHSRDGGVDAAGVQQAASKWEQVVDDLGPKVDITRYLRHYLLIGNPDVRKETVFKLFKNEVSKRGAASVLEDLATYATIYGSFDEPEREDIAKNRPVLKALSTLRAVRCYPALMPARRYLHSSDFIEFARLAEVLTYRYSSICGLDAKTLETVYHRAAKILHERRSEGLADASRELIEKMPPAAMFTEAFMRQSLKSSAQYLARYTLQGVETELNPGKEFKDPTAVNIEHIVPQALDATWQQDLRPRTAEHTDYVDRWGNLTLLFAKLNKAASNASFAKKRLEYAKSKVLITRQLCSYERFDFDEVETRQLWMANLADKIWSPPSDARRAALTGFKISSVPQ